MMHEAQLYSHPHHAHASPQHVHRYDMSALSYSPVPHAQGYMSASPPGYGGLTGYTHAHPGQSTSPGVKHEPSASPPVSRAPCSAGDLRDMIRVYLPPAEHVDPLPRLHALHPQHYTSAGAGGTELGREGSSLSRERLPRPNFRIHTYSSSSGGILRRSQASRET
ncbi:hypothetical protein WMY93_022377 [Mugilogobius chulae]|uniref:Uncharacterized protein n=1 Tax=Mugilogobius chulae TaxID=88201 RepID=A0AAW0NBQ2_9GOBI